MSTDITGNDHRDPLSGRYTHKAQSEGSVDLAAEAVAAQSHDDEAAAQEVLDAASRFTTVDADEIATHLASTPWGVRYRAAVVAGEPTDETITEVRAAMEHLRDRMPRERLASAELAVTDAVVAARNFGKLGGEEGWTLDEYDQLTGPWRNVVGAAHPGEADIPKEVIDQVRESTEDPTFVEFDPALAPPVPVGVGDVRPSPGREVFFEPGEIKPPF